MPQGFLTAVQVINEEVSVVVNRGVKEEVKTFAFESGGILGTLRIVADDGPVQIDYRACA